MAILSKLVTLALAATVVAQQSTDAQPPVQVTTNIATTNVVVVQTVGTDGMTMAVTTSMFDTATGGGAAATPNPSDAQSSLSSVASGAASSLAAVSSVLSGASSSLASLTSLSTITSIIPGTTSESTATLYQVSSGTTIISGPSTIIVGPTTLSTIESVFTSSRGESTSLITATGGMTGGAGGTQTDGSGASQTSTGAGSSTSTAGGNGAGSLSVNLAGLGLAGVFAAALML